MVVVSIQVGCQEGGGHNGEKKFIALFHVSEHSEHFKSILKFNYFHGWGVQFEIPFSVAYLKMKKLVLH